MDRPYIICHMLASIDSRINGDFFAAPETLPALSMTSRIRQEYACDAVLNGTVTAAEIYADGYVGALPKSEPIPRVDMIAPHTERKYAVALDAEGTLNWTGGTIARRGREPVHAVTLLTERVSDSYLAFLKEKGVSYIFAGKEQLDLKLAMEKLKALLGIEKLILTGGGVLNFAMLQADLIDELSVVIAPVVDGSTQEATLFDQSPFAAGEAPAAFRLKAVRQEGDVVWLNYTRRSI